MSDLTTANPHRASRPAATIAGSTSVPGWECGGRSRAAQPTPPASCSRRRIGLRTRMPGPPVHVHPRAEESYEVIEGALEVFMNGNWSPVRAGEKATVPAGVPHSVRNASDEPARIVNIHRPAQRFESFFRGHAQADPRRQDQAAPAEGCRAPPSTRQCCSASTRMRSERPNHPIRYSKRWPLSAGRCVSKSRGCRLARE